MLNLDSEAKLEALIERVVTRTVEKVLAETFDDFKWYKQKPLLKHVDGYNCEYNGPPVRLNQINDYKTFYGSSLPAQST